MLQEIEAERLETGAEYRGEVSREPSAAATAEGPNDGRQRTMTKSNGNASDLRRKLAAAMPPDEPVAGSDGQPESIPPRALLVQVLDRANLQRALKQERRNQGAPGIGGMTVDELPEYLISA